MEKIFPEVFSVKKPSDRAPDFVRARIGIKLENFTDWANEHTDDRGWVNIDILESKDGNFYPLLNTYKKTADADDVEPKSFKPDITQPHHPDSPF